VHYTSSDGLILSKPYTPKQEDGFNMQFASAGGGGGPISIGTNGFGTSGGSSITGGGGGNLSSGVDTSPVSLSGNSSNTPGNNSSGSLPASSPENNGSTYGNTSIPVNTDQALEQQTLPINPTRPLTIDELKKFEIWYPDAHGNMRHSGRSKAYLKIRATAEGKRYTSTYFSDNEYAEAVNAVLKYKAADIENWLLNSPDITKAFEYNRLDGYYGWVYDKVNDRYYKNNIAWVVLRKNSNGDIYIVTNYVKE